MLTTAEVMDVHVEWWRRSSGYVLVEFEDRAGDTIETRVHSYTWDDPRRGDSVDVLYDPKYPHNAVGADIEPDYLVTWLVSVGGLVAGVLIWPTWTGRIDWRKLA